MIRRAILVGNLKRVQLEALRQILRGGERARCAARDRSVRPREGGLRPRHREERVDRKGLVLAERSEARDPR